MESAPLVPTKKILAKERLILALDLDFKRAKTILNEIGDDISIVKINFLSYIELWQNPKSKDFLEELMRQGKDFFLDFKFDDIANTVESYVNEITKLDHIKFFTIHGNSSLMKAAKAGKNGKSDLKILIVTVLTSLDENDLQDIYSSDKKPNMKDVVRNRVQKALDLGIDGVIASGHEVKMIREMAEASDQELIIVTPGVRLELENNNDHKRATTPRDAILAGSDYLVVGRPIYNSENPSDTLQMFLREMQQAFDEKYNQ